MLPYPSRLARSRSTLMHLRPGHILPRLRTRWAVGAAALLAGICFGAEKDAVHLNAIPEFAARRWDAVPRLEAKIANVFAAQQDVAGYNMHPALTHFDGKYWAMWSSGAWGEDMPGQKVRFATSADGLQWSEAAVLAEPDPEFMLTPTGFWVRDGELFAMAAHRRGKPVVNGKRQQVPGKLDNTVRIYRYDAAQGAWNQAGALPDTFNDKPVERLSTGEWAMIRNTLEDRRYFGIGGTKSLEDWTYFPIPLPLDGHHMTEAHLYELPDGTLSLLFRDNTRSHFLYRAFSADRGRTWTNPVQTDFPDQTAKFSVLRLSTGPYVLASNPREAEDRFPLTLSVSRDGVVFERAYVVVEKGPPARFPNFTKRPGAQYPQLLEAGGCVWVIFSLNQESIQIARVPLDGLR
jgi:hypothetical protein